MGGRTVLVAVASVDQGRMPEPRGETEAADRGEMEAAMAGAGAILEAARSLVGRGGGGIGERMRAGSEHRTEAGRGRRFSGTRPRPSCCWRPDRRRKNQKKIVPARSGETRTGRSGETGRRGGGGPPGDGGRGGPRGGEAEGHDGWEGGGNLLGAAFGGLGKQNFLCRINLEPKRTADGGVGSWEPKLPEPKAKKKNWEERHPCMGTVWILTTTMRCSATIHTLFIFCTS